MAKSDDILKLARLSMLTLSDEEAAELSEDMKTVISFADMLNKGDFCENTDISDDFGASLREDIINPSYERADILKNAKTSEDGYFRLPTKNETGSEVK